jgi:hypothetical protein
MNCRQTRKLILTTLATSLLLAAAGTAQADDRGYRDGYGRHHAYSQQRHYRHAPQRHYRQAYHHDHGRHALRSGLKVAAGAVILGSIIHSINDDRRDRVVYRTRSIAPRSDLYYRIDPDGQCVEVSHNQRGQEVWTYVDPSYCY